MNKTKPVHNPLPTRSLKAKILRNFSINLFVILFTLKTFSAQAQWKLGSYSLQFSTHNAGFLVQGNISKMDLVVNGDDPSHPEFSLRGSANVGSLSTQNRMRDRHLMEEDYFDMKQFPEIEMESISFRGLTKDRYMSNFKLKIKNHTKIIEFPFVFKTEEPGKAKISGEFKINRRDFHVGGGSLILSDSISVKIQAVLTK